MKRSERSTKAIISSGISIRPTPSASARDTLELDLEGVFPLRQEVIDAARAHQDATQLRIELGSEIDPEMAAVLDTLEPGERLATLRLLYAIALAFALRERGSQGGNS